VVPSPVVNNYYGGGKRKGGLGLNAQTQAHTAQTMGASLYLILRSVGKDRPSNVLAKEMACPGMAPAAYEGQGDRTVVEAGACIFKRSQRRQGTKVICLNSRHGERYRGAVVRRRTTRTTKAQGHIDNNDIRPGQWLDVGVICGFVGLICAIAFGTGYVPSYSCYPTSACRVLLPASFHQTKEHVTSFGALALRKGVGRRTSSWTEGGSSPYDNGRNDYGQTRQSRRSHDKRDRWENECK
jgi:hypothetical protein